MKNIYLQAIGLWFVFMVFAIANGIARNSLYQDKIGELGAHQLSTFIAMAGFILIIFLFLKFSKSARTGKDLIVIGLLWALMTIAFEFLFGHYIAGHPWPKLLADYNILAGRLWSLVLLTLLLAPWLINKFIIKK